MPTYDAGITGLTGTVGATILDEDGAEHIARSTAGITEPVAGSGIYYVADHDPDATLTYVWDNGVGTVGASETLYAGREDVPDIKEKTANLPSDPADQSAVEAAITAAHSTTNGKIDAVDDLVDDLESRLTSARAGYLDALNTGVPVASLAAGAITAAAIATNAIDDDALAADAVTAIQSGLATASALDAVDNFLDTEVAAILTAVDTEVGAIKAKTDNLPTDPADESALEAAITAATSPLATAAAVAALNDVDAGDVQTAAAAALSAYDPPTRAEATADKEAIIAALPEGSDAPTAGEVADAVWEEAIADHDTAGSTGAALASAGIAGDPWTAELPGDYEEGTAGALLPDLEGALSTLGAAAVTVTSPVAASGAVTIYAGDDYDATHGRELSFTVADATHALGLDDPAAVVKFKCQQATWTGTATSTDDGYTVVFQPDAADTAAITVARQNYELEATLSDGDVVTLATGTLAMVSDIPEVV